MTEDGKKRFTESDLPYFRDLIEKKRDAIYRELGYLEETSLRPTDEYSGDNSTYSLHMADQGTDAQEREKAFLFAARENKFLNHLTRALERMKKGNYGHCAECGRSIQFARLEAVPHATLCIDCKKEQEEKRFV